MKRHFAVVALGILGDTSFSRVFFPMVIALGIAAFVYWVAFPTALPLWPGAVIFSLGVVAGISWEMKARRE